jgi:hypothetical protein
MPQILPQHRRGGARTVLLSARKATDADANGAIALAEIYGEAKLVTATQGAQTPGIAHNQMAGETPLF